MQKNSKEATAIPRQSPQHSRVQGAQILVPQHKVAEESQGPHNRPRSPAAGTHRFCLLSVEAFFVSVGSGKWLEGSGKKERIGKSSKERMPPAQQKGIGGEYLCCTFST